VLATVAGLWLLSTTAPSLEGRAPVTPEHPAAVEHATRPGMSLVAAAALIVAWAAGLGTLLAWWSDRIDARRPVRLRRRWPSSFGRRLVRIVGACLAALFLYEIASTVYRAMRPVDDYRAEDNRLAQ